MGALPAEALRGGGSRSNPALKIEWSIARPRAFWKRRWSSALVEPSTPNTNVEFDKCARGVCRVPHQDKILVSVSHVVLNWTTGLWSKLFQGWYEPVRLMHNTPHDFYWSIASIDTNVAM